MKLAQRSLVDLLAAFRSPAPTPGGGSAAALVAAVGASLVAMIGSMARHRAETAADVDHLRGAARRCIELSDRLAALVDEDADAYDLVMSAYKFPKETTPERTERARLLQEALRQATDVPLEVMRCCAAALDRAVVVAALGNPTAVTDVGVALELLRAAARGAKLNVEINLASVTDNAYADDVRRQMGQIVEDCERAEASARAGRQRGAPS